jgi:serine palmitoyltransferase
MNVHHVLCKSKESFGNDMDSPEAVEVSSTSSGIASDTDSSDDNNPSLDPYADVRDKLEALSARDKAEFAFHKQTDGVHGEPTIPTFAAVTTYLGYAVLIVCGHIRDIFARLFQRGRYVRRTSQYPSDDVTLFAPLLKSWENFYTRRLYHRIQDCFNRPIASSPGTRIQVLERVSRDGNKTMDILGPLDNLETIQQKTVYTSGSHFVALDNDRVARSCLNLGSYNYLGFADDWDVTCRKDVVGSLEALPVSMSSSSMEFGTTKLHRKVEQLVASFLGKEDALCLNMGFNTNATTIPALVTQGDLIISDALNHTSIVNGARGSGAAIRTFRHNDTSQLEEILREAIIMGRPRTRRPWNKILVIVEGIYSMEGEYCDLRKVVNVSKKYGAYVYLDEAHSVGAMGPTGRGCAEYTGVDTADIDIMMGTFTKSFGGMGGYIAGSKEVISFLRQKCAGSTYHNALSPVVCQQIISSFQVRKRYVLATNTEMTT